MSNLPSARETVVLGPQDGESRITVSMEAYMAFDARISQSLDELLAKWSVRAAPNTLCMHRNTLTPKVTK